MRAIRFHEIGGPEVLRLERVSDPIPGPGRAVIRIEAAGVNFSEIYQRTGLYKVGLPATPGSEAAGVVVAVGEGVADVAPGDRVVSTSVSGAYAELALVQSDRLVKIPDGITARQAAAVMLQGMTAHYLACATRPLGPGDTCLVHAAAGGVGLLLCQIAKRRGARVFGTVSTAEKARLAREAGADEVIRYAEQDVEAEVRRLTHGAGVQVVYDSVGRATFEASLRSLARRGMLVLFGQSSGPVGAVDPQALNQHGSLFLTRPALQHYTATRAELLERANEVFAWVRDGSLKVRVDRERPLADAAEAHRALGSRATTGKLLLIP
ncbi:MAG: quinone oxidoreductase [Candidatus Eisenbacteria bacterium]|uniref:Quinone oxidoreductase n=1 Tax=Eiseniibacteriota bacterium TaxID=2212470 RepID=A0A9D6LAW0_UNCEI|nr:quinone oxidoreductase [Candidatus Eisenbacteria bacterium]MBI3539808.1 quinone oxidoreductase [Candidatus Eisenbacteria bacterium]